MNDAETIQLARVSALKKYFEQTDTPSENSPVGKLMLKILEQCPNLSFEQAREQAHKMLERAAGKWRYALPEVRTPEEEAARQVTFRALNARKGSKGTLQHVLDTHVNDAAAA